MWHLQDTFLCGDSSSANLKLSLERRFCWAQRCLAALGKPRPAGLSDRCYEEDWSFLADPSLRQDPWDRWKYIDLHHPDWYLTVAGEARERYEVLDHPVFGAGPTDTNGHLLQRYLFSGDFHFGKRFRFFGELQSGLEEGRNGGPRLTDLDKLDIHQAFADIGLIRREHQKFTLRLGRQEVRFGTGRLISPGEGLNVRRSFDGARLIYETGRWLWNATALRLVHISTGFFDELPDHTQTFWGVGVIGPHRFWPGANFTIYYLGDDRKDALFDKGQGPSSRQLFHRPVPRTISARTLGELRKHDAVV
jgi:hypothetical protein